MSEQAQSKREHRRARNAFSLVEMLIVIVILGILAMVIVPQITSSTDDAKFRTLQTDLSAMRSAVEIYHAQHNGIYPATTIPTSKPAGITTIEASFEAQMTRYTDVNGNIANSKDDSFKFGPYVKGGALPTNPYNNKSNITIDSIETDITKRSSGAVDTGWKFYSKTGVLIPADGAHDTI